MWLYHTAVKTNELELHTSTCENLNNIVNEKACFRRRSTFYYLHEMYKHLFISLYFIYFDIFSIHIHFSILGYIDSKVCIYRYRESKNLKKLIGMRITKLSWQAPPGMGGEGDVESGYQPHQSYFIFQTSDEYMGADSILKKKLVCNIS